jgi:hypothetical protein
MPALEFSSEASAEMNAAAAALIAEEVTDETEPVAEEEAPESPGEDAPVETEPPTEPDEAEPPAEPEPAQEAAGAEAVVATAAAAPAAVSDEDLALLAAYKQLDARLNTDAALAARFQELFGTADAPEPIVDESVAPLYQQLQQLQGQVTSHAQYLAQQQQIEIAATTNRVAEQFKADHTLDTVAYNKVYDHAQSFANVLQSFMSQGLDRQSALTRTLELAYWDMPEFREAEIARQQSQVRKDNERKAKAGSLSGSSGSLPRTQKVPTNPQEIREAMIRDLAASQGIE